MHVVSAVRARGVTSFRIPKPCARSSPVEYEILRVRREVRRISYYDERAQGLGTRLLEECIKTRHRQDIGETASMKVVPAFLTILLTSSVQGTTSYCKGLLVLFFCIA